MLASAGAKLPTAYAQRVNEEAFEELEQQLTQKFSSI